MLLQLYKLKPSKKYKTEQPVQNSCSHYNYVHESRLSNKCSYKDWKKNIYIISNLLDLYSI